jgi:hypothetical protein
MTSSNRFRELHPAHKALDMWADTPPHVVMGSHAGFKELRPHLLLPYPMDLQACHSNDIIISILARVVNSVMSL